MKQTDPQFKLRLDEDLKAALTSAAKQNQRTLSAEIVARLQASFSESPIGPSADKALLVDVVSAMAVMIRSLGGELGPDTDPKGLKQLTESFNRLNERIRLLHTREEQ